ncbi:MAG: proteasome subunit beta [Candidatus Woesearchaeota archaeon]|nr:MAG: proteasome subunit beta [Candidatus Woesearchaeota archaeon]
MSENVLKTGTTTVGLIYKDGVVIAADKRATAGNLIVDKSVTKLIKINDYMGVTISGSVSDIQLMTRYLKAELKLKEIRTNRKNTVSEGANLLAGLAYSQIRSYFPGIGHFIVAGYDESPQLYDVFPDGSITEHDQFDASGSGSVFAFGLLENNYKDNMSEGEAVDLALRSISAAQQRDNASGNGVDIWLINKDGIKEVTTKIPQTRLV